MALGTIYTHGWPGLRACGNVAAKNDAKTWETHELSKAGKLVRKIEEPRYKPVFDDLDDDTCHCKHCHCRVKLIAGEEVCADCFMGIHPGH